MDYRNVMKISIIIICSGVILFNSCSDNIRSDKPTNYYLEFVNFNDSLERYISSNILGKVAFYKNNKIEVISTNYITDLTSEMHYFKSINEVDGEVTLGTKKIRIEFFGDYNIDSIKYSLQKYNYKNSGWSKISDLGTLKGFTTYKRAKEFAIKEFGNQIIKNIAAYTYE